MALLWGSGEINLVDVASGQRIGDPIPGGGGVPVGVLSPDGRMVLTGGVAPVTVWEIDPASWKAKACKTVGRNLTRTEWAQYLPDDPYRTTCPEWPESAQGTWKERRLLEQACEPGRAARWNRYELRGMQDSEYICGLLAYWASTFKACHALKASGR